MMSGKRENTESHTDFAGYYVRRIIICIIISGRTIINNNMFKCAFVKIINVLYSTESKKILREACDF